MKANEFRVLGEELGETDSFVDVTINGIDEDGALYFSDTDSDREWSFTHRETRNLMGQNLMVESEKVQQHKLWDLAKTIEEKGIRNASDEFAVENVREAQRSIFLAAYFETR